MSGGCRAGVRRIFGKGREKGRKANRRAVAACLSALVLAGCENAIRPDQDPDTYDSASRGQSYLPPTGSVLGDGGLFDIFGSGKKDTGGGSGIGVNNFLWRATLDTLSFMPLASADPFGGVIITDWYAPPESPNERFKMNVYILGRELRADGVRVAVFRQNRAAAGQAADGWVDAQVSEQTAANLENEILTRARQLRFATRAETGR